MTYFAAVWGAYGLYALLLSIDWFWTTRTVTMLQRRLAAQPPQQRRHPRPMTKSTNQC